MPGAFIADCREMVREQVEYRDLLAQMTRRDLLLRYKQTVMGFGWAVLMPVINTVLFSVIFTRVASLPTPVAYPLYAFTGLWVWNFFSSALRFSVTSLTSNVTLVSKVYFPREIFPFSAVIVSLVDFAVGAVVLAGLMAWYGVLPGGHVLWLPLIILVHVTFTTAIALVLAMANLFYRDVKYLFEVAVMIWMFGTSVLYPLDRVDGVAGALLRGNPMTVIVDSYRAVLLLDAPPPWALLVTGLAAAVGLVCAWVLFHRSEFEFAERV